MFFRQVAIPLALAMLVAFQLGREYESAHQNRQKKRKALKRIPSKNNHAL